MRLMILALTLAALVGCGPSKSEHDALKRRVATLEKRLQVAQGRAAMKGGKGSKAKHRKGKKKPRAGAVARGTVKVEGDAAGVYVASERHRLPVPGQIRAGDFKLLAVWTQGSAPVEVGSIEIEAGKSTLVTCKKELQTCTVKAPE